jgi:hypothetical protein
MAKVPRTLPPAVRIGVDQQARRSCGNAIALKSAHSGSFSISETKTGWPV